MSEIKDFLKALSENPEARKLMQEAKEPANAEEAAALYAEIAEKTGISVTEDAIRKLLEEKEKIQQAATAKAEGAVKESLDLKDLDAVAGGKDPRCEDSFIPGEWCWFSDSCSVIITSYSDQSHFADTDIRLGDDEYVLVTDCEAVQLGINMSPCKQPSYDDMACPPVQM